MRRSRLARWLPVLMRGGAQSYASRVLSLSPIAYWPLSETSGVTADNLEGTAARDGTYSNTDGTLDGITLANLLSPDGVSAAPLFDGIAGLVNIYSADFAGAFSGLEGTFACWCKVSAEGIWGDGVNRAIVRLRVNASNSVDIVKAAAANTITFTYTAGGTSDPASSNALGAVTDWFHVACTWSDSGDITRLYTNGIERGTRDTLGNWTGALSSSNVVLASQNATTPAALWSGWLAHAAVWATPLSAPVIASLANFP